jgi:glycine hydroxymethyltransferase
MVLVDVLERGLTGVVAEKALEACGIVINKNRIPGDRRPAQVTSGIRLGTNTLAARGLAPADMKACADLVDRVLAAVRSTSDSTFELDAELAASVRSEVRRLCAAFPLPRYPRPSLD